MLSHTTLVFGSFLTVVWSAEDLSFPPGFKFGVASAAYQVEGAWNTSDKGENIWDRFCHKVSSPIEDGSSGDVACDSYTHWKEDINMVAEVGAHFYRISISWSRLLPTGFEHHISEDGKRYYNNLIDGLLEKGIEPVITLYHWDLPQRLQDLGGWTNPLVAQWFANYARVVFSLYGDRVKTWITINEPWVVCDVAYMTGVHAPGIVNHQGAYICTKNILMAHAKAWRIYDEEFKPKYHGQVSFCNHLIWMEPANANEEATAELMREYLVGRFSHAIYSKEGGWPPAIEKVIAAISKKEGYPRSILPAFTKEEIEFMKGAYDFYGMNLYSSRVVRMAKEGEELRPWPFGDVPDCNVKMDIDPDWPRPYPFFPIHPEGMRRQLVWLKKHYGDIPVFITENGRGTNLGLDDYDRIEYYKNYLKQVLLAIKEDGVNVTAYTAWTIMDNFEWTSGYNVRFGLYEVDFTSPQRTRTPRSSAKYYASVVKSHSLDVLYDSVNITSRSSKSQSNSTNYIIFGGIIMVIIVATIAAIVGYRLKRKAIMEKKKHRYIAVKNGHHNDTENGTRNGSHNGTLNGTNNGVKNGTHNGVKNYSHNDGSANGANGFQERIPLTA